MKHSEKYLCPFCNLKQPAEHFVCQFSAKGGKASGERKARTSEQAAAAGRAGAKKRWAAYNKAKRAAAAKQKEALPKSKKPPKK